MIVKKYRYNQQLCNYEEIRTIEVEEDKVLTELATDLPYAGIATYMYEAGKMVGNRFIPELIWSSESAHLFD